MSRIYEMSVDADQVIPALRDKRIEGLELVHQPKDEEGRTSLWPYGVKDQQGNLGWFEGYMVMFWGLNKETNIIKLFAKAGVDLFYIG